MLSILRRLPFRLFAAGVASLLITVACLAQQRTLTADDYSRAEKFMNYNTAPLVLRAGARPTWLADGRFWYRVTTENGGEFILVDP
ncbi:MAG: S9 family peptidase, partial [Acidobacteriota bacterium]